MKQRERAESMTPTEYFIYAVYQNWMPRYIQTMKMEEILCPECNYVPRSDSTQPRRAFKAHVKKYHARLYSEKYMKPFIIQEEPDFDSPYADVALAYA